MAARGVLRKPFTRSCWSLSFAIHLSCEWKLGFHKVENVASVFLSSPCSNPLPHRALEHGLVFVARVVEIELSRIYLDDTVASVWNSRQFVAAKFFIAFPFACVYSFLEIGSTVTTMKACSNEAYMLVQHQHATYWTCWKFSSNMVQLCWANIVAWCVGCGCASL